MTAEADNSGPTALWPVLAPLEPRLSPDARVDVQHFRGEPWFVVTDRAGGDAYRVSGAMRVVLTPEAGSGTLNERVERAFPQADGVFLEQLALAIVQLYRTSLLDLGPDVPVVLRELRAAPARKRRWNPLAIRLPLCDPDRWLTRLEPRLRFLFRWPAVAAMLAIVVILAVLSGMHAEALHADLLSRLSLASNWALFALCYLVLKAFHELSHALAVKRWGGHVHDVGVMLLVFLPVPYVDASASTAFTDKRQRMVVAVAGIAAELVAAGIAMMVWLNTEPGLVHAAAFNVVVIGSVSTLLFNGNPLMRFDAYYAFSDLVEIPNLYNRARSYLSYLTLKCLAGAGAGPSPASSRSEARWLLGYGVSSSVYRIGVMFAIALYLASEFFFLGAALAAWLLATEFVGPVARLSGQLRKIDLRARSPFAGRARAIGIVVAVGAFLAWAPLPQSTIAVGVVTVGENAQLRAASDGFIGAVPGRAEVPVRAGAPVLTLANDELVRDLAAARARVVELEAERTAAATVDRVAAGVIEESLQASRRAEAEIAARVENLTVRSPAAGRLVTPDLDRLRGHYVERGQQLGYVSDAAHLIVRLVVPESRLDLFQVTPRSVSVRYAEAPHRTFRARPVGGVPASLTRLPSAALGSQGHGPIPVDPADPDGLTPLVKVFQLDLETADGPADLRVSGLAYARFEHAPEPLLPRAVRAARRLFLAKFST